MTVFFYVQHLLGIGHLKRAATLARALRDAGFRVVLASGGVPVASIPVDVQLPPASAADISFKTLIDDAGQPIDEAWQRRRAGALLDAWRAARADVLMRDATWRLLAGVSATDADFRALAHAAGAGVIVERSRDDFQALLAAAVVSISQAGYNTVAEILQARVRSVLVPFAAGDEAEQTLRARLLAERGAAVMLEERALDPQSLADAVNRAARAPQPPAALVNLDGARRSAELVRQWLS